MDATDFAASASAQGIDMLECPVTGGVTRASAGEMTMFVGGADAVVQRHREALECLCQPVIHLGPPGSAATAKVITNMLCLIDLIAAVLDLGDQAPVDEGIQ